MDENVKAEIDIIFLMIKHWGKAYENLCVINEDNSIYIEELTEEINENIIPYILRLLHSKYITFEEYNEIRNNINFEIKKFNDIITSNKFKCAVENNINFKELISKFKIHLDLINIVKNDEKFIEDQKEKMLNIAIKIIPNLNKLCCCIRGNKNGDE